MIKNVISSSQHLFTTGGSSMPYVGYNSSNPAQGMLRLNGSDMEVFDGSNWVKIYMNDATVGMTGVANSAIDWAIKKMDEERAWKELAEKNQAVKIALDNLDKARQQLDITAKLAREYEQTTS